MGDGGGDAGGAGSSRGVALSCPHGKDNVVPQRRAPKCTEDPPKAEKPAKRRHGGRPTLVPVLTG